MKRAIIAAFPLALAGCAASTLPARPDNPNTPLLAYAGLGETVYVDGPSVTPLEVLEDSRCPEGVACVWAGRVRIKVRIHLGAGDRSQELTLGKPIQIADGSLELVQVGPARAQGAPIAPKDYSFGFRFMGGL